MTNREFVLDVDGKGRGKVTVDGQDLSNAVRGAQVTVVTGQPTLLALMPAAGYAGRIMGEGTVLEMTEGIGAAEFLEGVSAAELEHQVLGFMNTPEGSELSVTQAYLAVLLAQAVAESSGEAVESGS